MTSGSISHPQLLRLAVAALDFELTAAERAQLDEHLPGCAECRRVTARYRADLSVLGSVALVPAPPRVRSSVLGRAARPQGRRPAWQVLMVAALLAALLAGLALGAGALLELRDDLRSPISWQAAPDQASLAGGAGVDHVVAGNGIVLAAVERSSGRVILVSEDGESWREAGEAPAGAGELAFVPDGTRGGQFLALGESVESRPAVWWSTDGTAWTEEIVDPEKGSLTGAAVVDGSIHVTGHRLGMSETELPEEVRLTAAWRLTGDGWQAVAVPHEMESNGITALLPSPHGLVALSFGPNRLWLLSPGADRFVPIGVDPGVDPTHGVWGAGRAVVFGANSDVPLIRVSEDLESWHVAEPVSDMRGARISGLTFQGGLFVAVGDGGRGALVWTSADGLTWTSGTIPGGTGARLIDLALLGQTIVVVGTRGPDAAAWSGRIGR